MKVFVSYASEQKALAERLIAHLATEGHEVLAGSALFVAGEEFDRRIREAIDRSALFIFMISPAALAHGRYTLTELEYARSKWRNPRWHVLPVVAEPVPRDLIHPYLSPITWLEPNDNWVAAVVAQVARLAKRRQRYVAAAVLAAVLSASGAAYAVSSFIDEGGGPGNAGPSADAAVAPPPVDAHPGAPSDLRPSPQPKDAHPAPLDPLRALVRNPRCKARLEPNGVGRWYLSCHCPDDIQTPDDKLVATTGTKASLLDRAKEIGRADGWRCP
jgi:hypothetical protein